MKLPDAVLLDGGHELYRSYYGAAFEECKGKLPVIWTAHRHDDILPSIAHLVGRIEGKSGIELADLFSTKHLDLTPKEQGRALYDILIYAVGRGPSNLRMFGYMDGELNNMRGIVEVPELKDLAVERAKDDVQVMWMARELPDDDNENENCLEGMRCPWCGADNEFQIEGRVSFNVTDDGSETVGDHEWEDTDDCRCEACDFMGFVYHFTADFQMREWLDPSLPKAEKCGLWDKNKKTWTTESDRLLNFQLVILNEKLAAAGSSMEWRRKQ